MLLRLFDVKELQFYNVERRFRAGKVGIWPIFEYFWGGNGGVCEISKTKRREL